MKNTWIIVGVIVLLLAVGGLFLFQSQQNKSTDNSGLSSTQNQPSESTALEESAKVPAGTQSGTSASSTGEVKEFTINGSSFKFEPKQLKVKKGDTVKITFKNTGGIHDLVLPEFDVATKQLSSNQTEVVEFVADKKGSFEYFCSVGNHRQQGMVGTLVVE